MIRSIALTLLTCLLFATPNLTLAGEAQEPDLVIVHTNDLHARYRPFDSRGESRGGFARLSGQINILREQYGDRLIYLDAGDLFQGTPFYHFYRGELGMDLLDAMGCDAFALGNHELDDGHQNFLRASQAMSFPLLCANVSLPDGPPLLPASTRLTRGNLTIDVVGIITAHLEEVTGVISRGELTMVDPALALQNWLDHRKNEADLTVVLSHCGLSEDIDIAANVTEPPLIISGHSHSFIDEPARVGDTIICTTGAYGYNLGVLKLWQEGDSWRMEHELIPMNADSPEDPKIAALIEEAAVVVDREMAVEVGELAEDFPTQGKSGAANPLGQWIAELLRVEAGADIGLQNVGGYRTSLNGGDMSRGDVFTLLPFDNRIVRLTFHGDVLQELFDYLAECFGSGRFAQTSGVSYRVENGKARDILIDGKPLDPAAHYKVATLDFLLGGGDGYTVLQKAHTIDILDAFPRDVMENWLLAGNIPSPTDFPPNVFSSDEPSDQDSGY